MDTGASQDEEPRLSQKASPSAISGPPVRPENPRAVSPVHDVPMVGLSIKGGHNSPPRSPAVSAVTVSEYDIELDPLPPPAPGTYSTDQLVPKQTELRTEITNSAKQLEASSWPPPTTTPLRPNYKPLPLRWAYHILLLILIAGFFAFLEYETRLLPEPGFHAFRPVPQHIQDPSRARRDSAEENPFFVEPTQTTSKTSSARPGIITAPPRIRPRDPSPIPPESEYPKPNDGSDYCFWYPPRWRFRNLLFYFPMLEYIQFFTVSEDNEDLPLCPCHNVIYEEDNTTRVRLGSVDEYCDAVINVIKTVNAMEDRLYSYWQGGFPYTTNFPWWNGPDQYWMTPPQMTVPWIYPSFAPNGDVFLPLERRTTAPGPNGEAVSDVFGKRLEAPYVGYFPAGHTGIETLWTYYGMVYTATDTITHPATRSILWWQLPLTRPDSLFTADLPTSMSSPASASPGIITTDDIPTSASATPPPSSPSEPVVSLPSSSSEQAVSSPSSPSEPVVSSTPSASLQPSTSPESVIHISTNSEVVVFPIPTSSSSTRGNQDPSTLTIESNSSLKPLPLTTSDATTTSTAAQVLTSDDIIWTTNIIASTSLTTVGTSTRTDIVPVTSDGTTSFTTLTTTIPLVSTTTFLSTQPNPTTTKPPGTPSLPRESPNAATTTRSGPVQLDTMLISIPTQLSTMTYFDDNGLPTSTFTGTFDTYTTFIVRSSTTEALTMTLQYYRPRPGSPINGPDGPHTWNPNGGPFEPDKHKFFSLNSEKDFLMASLIPVLLATFLAVPIQIFIKTFNHMIPFRALRHRERREAGSPGADARDSLSLSRGGMNVFTAPKISFRFIREYQDPLPLLCFVLDILTTLLIPLSSETIQIEFGQNWCTSLDWPVVPFGYRGPCAIGLRKSVVPSRTAEVFLCIMSAIILLMGFVLWRWRTGVATDPWSVASMAALLSGSSQEVKRLMLGISPPHLPQPPASSNNTGSVERNASDSEVKAANSKDIAKAFEGKRFRLGYFQVPSSSDDHWGSVDKQQGVVSAKKYQPWNQREPYQQHMSYGLQLVSPDQAETGSVRLTVKDPPARTPSSTQPETTPNLSLAGKLFIKTKQSLKRVLPSKKNTASGVSKRRPTTTNLLHTVFLVLIIGLLILILYYENTILDTPFERFMDSQTYGVRFLFTAMGTGITTFWDYYFSYICEKEHFSQLQTATPNPGHEGLANITSSHRLPSPSGRTMPQEQKQETREERENRQSGNGNTARPHTGSTNKLTTHIAGKKNPENLSPTMSSGSSSAEGSAATAKTNLSSAATLMNPTAAPVSPANPTPSPRKAPTTTINTILSPIPSTELHALYHAFSRREAQPKDRLTLAFVSIATFLSKFAPILLSGIPFRNTVTWKMHETYTWTLVFVLTYMVLVLGVLLVPRAVPLYLLGRCRKIARPRKNVREDTCVDGRQLAPPPPTSIAGYMYYVCDSHMLRDFEGLSTASRKARDKAVMEMNNSRGHEDDTPGGRGYFIGALTGVSGANRIGIDYVPVS